MNETRTLVKFLVGLKYEALPSEVVAAAKLALLDHFGVGLFGSRMEWSKMVCEFAEEAGSKMESTVWGHSLKVTAQDAALVNGTATHGIEMDDRKPSLGLHQGSCTVPAALATAEKAKADGKTLITAMVAGYELPFRVAFCMKKEIEALHAPGHRSIWGSVAAASKALGLGEEQMLNACGLAGSMAAGIWEFSSDPEGTMVKRLHAGAAAHNGVKAALLGAKGFTGPRTVLEGKYGYCNVFARSQTDVDPAELTRDLGGHFQILDREVKAYSAWGGSHYSISTVKQLKAEHDIDPEQIEKIVIGASRRHINQHEIREPQSIMAGQYSLPFVTAISYYYDLGDPSVWTEDVLRDERVLRLSRKVEWYVDEEKEKLSQKTHSYEGVKHTVTLKNGQELQGGCEKLKGTLENPMTADEVRDKFRLLAGYILPAERVGQIIQMVDSLESVSDVCKLGELLQV